MELLIPAILIVFGLIIGSFLSVCVYRVPLKISVATPRRSFCPNCKAQLKWYQNIPLLSWVALRGKCSGCSNKISIRYPIIEIIAAIASFGSFTTYGLTFTGFGIFVYCCSLIVLAFIDLEHFILPNVITIPGFFISIAVAIINSFFHVLSPPFSSGIVSSFWGFIAGAGFLYAVARIHLFATKRVGLGFGDVKFLAYTGILFGPQCSLFTIFFGSLLGCLVVLVKAIFVRGTLSREFPFGPYLTIATAIYLFFGTEIMTLWLGYPYPNM